MRGCRATSRVSHGSSQLVGAVSGFLLKVIRESAGLTQARLAEDLGVITSPTFPAVSVGGHDFDVERDLSPELLLLAGRVEAELQLSRPGLHRVEKEHVGPRRTDLTPVSV
jgi:transcriptional regulator with XRE-family HTH domain